MAKKSFKKTYLPFLLAVIMVFETLIPCLTVFAAGELVYTGGTESTVADLDTSMKFTESLGDNASTEYSGRIWTDKSVYNSDKTFALWGGGSTTIKLNEAMNGEDFLIAYSALATSDSISGQTEAPVDVVFVIDTSGSMTDPMSSTDSTRRIKNTVDALNDAIEALMEMNEYVRVGVVAFANTSEELLPLGRYEKGTRTSGNGNNQTSVTDYFSLNSNGSTLYIHVKEEGKTQQINDIRSVSGGTNIQRGVYAGMNMLATSDSVTANVNGSSITRYPSLVLLSDGAPTYSSDSSAWWAPENNDNDGPGNSAYFGNGFKTLMTAAYMKNAVNEHYGSAYEMKLYTIGMGISGLSNRSSGWGSSYYTGEKDLAYMTLNPGAYWTADNNMAKAVVNAWTTYTNQTANGNGTSNVQVGSNENYTLRHPQSPLKDIYTASNKDALKNVVDSYYDADNASAVTTVFENIVTDIAISVPVVPTEIKEGLSPTESGYITFTDPIGEYMEVKDIKSIIYAGQEFKAKTKSTSGNVTTYTFSGEVHSEVYGGDQDIAEIRITVTKDSDGNETLVIEIPASVIPLRVNTITLNEDGSVKTHTNNGAFPCRVIYSVGMQSRILKKSDSGIFYVDTTKLSSTYLENNTNEDGSINFYANRYTDMHLINGSTVGDAMVDFEPAHNNGFYYILEDMPIYKDEALTQQLTVSEGIDDATTYYYKDIYYHGSSVEITPIARTGAQLSRTEIKTGADGYLYRAEGSPRLNRILKFEGTKVANATGTAEDFYAPEFRYAEGSTNAYDGRFTVHQGNNGKLSLVAGGNLEISKEVTAEEGLTAPDKDFEFTIDLNGASVSQGEFDYHIYNADGSQAGVGTVSASNPKVTLRAGQKAVIISLPPDTTYTVTEADVDGFTRQSEGATGTIGVGQTSVVKFTNNYSVEEVTFQVGQGTKVLTGRAGTGWGANDSFAFFINPYNNAPLPEGYNASTGIVVTQPDVAGGDTATFDLGTIKFKAPGVYRYTIYEDEPDDMLPGMSYSRALYRLVVTVVDNGNGTLTVTNSDIQKLYTDDATALFTYGQNNEIILNPGEEGEDDIKFINKYTADDVVRVPVALKDYTDNSGENPLVSGMFEFELKAVGIVENGTVVNTDITKVPMPQGASNGVITTTNEGHNVTFPGLTFTQQMLMDLNASSVTFRYEMREVIPANRVNGMTYDDTVYTIDVTVSIDGGSTLNVSVVYPDGVHVPTFKNTYTPKPVEATVNGTKVLNGRHMASGETFDFNIDYADDATLAAINSGIVEISDKTASVSDGLDGVAKAFSFAPIQFKKAGTYSFKVTEVAGTRASVEYDDSKIIVTVVVEDANKDGNLEVKSITYSNGGNSADFVNTYTRKFTGNPVTVAGAKTLTGKTLLEGEFYFEVVEYYNGVKVGERYVTHTADTNGTNGVYAGAIKFLDNVTYTKPGSYQYIITEQIPDDANKVGGTTYDTSKYSVLVTVLDDLNGNLTATVNTPQKYDENAGVYNNVDVISFSNDYDPTPVKVTLPLIKKILEGDRSEPLKAGEFEFKMEIASANPSDGITPITNNTAFNAANGDIVFEQVEFTKAGLYVLKITEVEPDAADKVPGITYSTQTIYAAYRVDDDRNGTLTATLVQFYGGENIINKYEAESTEAVIEITKDFTGRKDDEWLSTDKFDFEIKAADEATKQAIANGDIEITLDNGSTDTVTKTIATKGNKASTTVKVNKIGTYTFNVTEKDGGINGITYDTTTKTVVIKASDDSANAKLVLEINGQAQNKATVNFVNTYASAESAPVEIPVTKVVTPSTGNAFNLKADMFSFVIEGSANAPMPAKTTVKNDAQGKVDFGTITFTQRGVYTYTIREEQGTLGGITYDGNVYTVTVTVTDDYANAKLVTSVAVTNTANKQGGIEFENKYNPKETSALIFGTKELQGGHKVLSADEFEFTIEAVTNGAPLPLQTTVKNSATGTFQFGTITYTKLGEYEYKITEKNLGKTGYTYDTTVYTVVVKVTDDNSNGQLLATVIGVGTAQDPAIKFVNKYVPKDVDVELGAEGELTKELDGRDIKDKEFIFAVLDGDKEITTAKNDANGLFKFELNFTKAGTYVYKVVEKNNGVAGVTYDDKIYNVEIKIVDRNGVLAVEKVVYLLENTPVEDVVFNNTYKPEDTDVTISAIKKLTGRQLLDGEFKFILKDEQGNEVATATNTKDGKIVFDKLVIKAAGNYKFSVYEENGTQKYVTYDKTEFIVEFTVTDDGNGKLTATTPIIRKEGNTDNVAEIIFENTYVAPDPDIPQTGFDAKVGLWITLLCMSGIGFVASVVYCRKQKETD
ncbi:MAG: VWA domain-containing protein [Clostridia bacterium]|nr:VWA domain-containing protein [Clostridia bacterium]